MSNCQFTWLKQTETLVSLAESLLKDSAFYDCQLYAQGHHFNVHRVILSCNSPVFSSILREHTSDLPVITLEGISSDELGALVEFMYTGVTRISPKYLKNFFQIAKSLQLVGLNPYDNAQIDKIINETGAEDTYSDFQDNYETYSENILKLLVQSEEDVKSGEKEMTTLSDNDESIFLGESSEATDIVNGAALYGKYEGVFVKDESEEVVETLETQIMESDDLSQTCKFEPVESSEIEVPAEAGIVYDQFSNVFIKNNNKVFDNNVATVYCISNVDDAETRKNKIVEVQDTKAGEGDENFVILRLDNKVLSRIKEKQISRGKPNSSKTDVRSFTKKYIKMVYPGEKNGAKTEGRNSKIGEDDKKSYICLKCGNKYSHRRTLLHHIHWICEQPATYSCSLCPYKGKRKFQLKSHMKHAHMLKMNH